MKKLFPLSCKHLLTQTTRIVVTFLFLCLTIHLKAQTVTITTDQDDYYPGEWVIISGTGWLPGDSVKLSITHIGDSIPNHTHEPWTLLADANGNLSDEWYVAEMELNTTLWLQAQSLTASSMYAEKVFTDATTLLISGSVKLANGTPISGVTVTDYKDSGLTIVEKTSLTRSSDGVWSFTLPIDVTRYVVVTPPTGYTCSNVIFGYAPNGTILSKVSNNGIKVIGGPNGGYSTGNQFILVLNNSIPTISTISPIVKCAGEAGFTLSVDGTNFNSNSVVNFNGSPRSTTFINSGLLYASITASDIEKAVRTSITVSNPIPGGGTSTGATLVVNDLPSAPSSVSNSFIYDGNTHFIAAQVNTGEDISWFDAPTGGNLISEVPFLKNVGSITAYAESRNTTTGCVSTTRTSVTLTITARPIVITADAKDKIYGDTDPALTAQVTLGTIVESDAASGLLTRAIGENVGSYLISKNNYTYGSNYAETFSEANLVIGQRPITITVDAGLTKVYGNDEPEFTFTSSELLISGNIFSGTLGRAEGENVDGGPYTYNLGTLSAGSNYALTLGGSSTFIITRSPSRTLVTIPATPFTYTGSAIMPATVSVTGAGGLIETHAPLYADNINAGTATASYSYAGDANHEASSDSKTFEIGKAASSTIISITGDPFTYTGSAITPASVNVTGAGELSLSPIPVYANNVNAGTATISYSYAGDANHEASSDSKTFIIGKANAIVSVTPYNINYDGLSHKASFTAMGVEPTPADLSGLVDISATEHTNAGMYPNDAWSFEGNENYNTASGTINDVIGQRSITITADTRGKTYGEVDPDLTAQVTSGTIVGTDAASGSLARAAGENVGSYLISKASYTYGSNYNETFIEDNFAIDQRPITITATGKSKTYGDPNPSLEASVTGTVNGDVLDYSLATTAEQFSGVGSYPIVVSSGTNPNYKISKADNTLLICKKDAEVSAIAKIKTYGDLNPELEASVTGTVHGDVLDYSLATAAEQFSGVGSYPIVVTLGTSPNYRVSKTDNILLIGQKEITVIPEINQHKVYGENNSVYNYEYSPALITGDEFSGSLSRVEGENVGMYEIIQGTLTLTSNYKLAFPSKVRFEISKRPITITVTPNQFKYCGQADPLSFDYSTSENGLVTGDICSMALERVSGECANDYPINIGSLSVLCGSVNKTSNYDITSIPANFEIKEVSLDASQSSTPVPLGSTPLLKAVVMQTVPGVLVNFEVESGNGTKTTFSKTTDDSGLAAVSAVGLTAVDVYKVTASVGTCTSSTAAYLALYDPNGGFVTGGGWINSPAGAYISEPSLTGKANFGFNSKYQKGKNTPDGNTEFQFQSGKLNFSSSNYSAGSLVISGAKATYKGTGAINGSGDYSFLVTVIDGDVTGGVYDKFRIKIWDANKVIYDNNVGSAGQDDNDLPVTTLGGGSIVIHNDKTKSAEIQESQITESQNIVSCNIIVPNGFSPNADGLNDYFKVTCLNDYPDAALKIYTSAGRLVYEQQHYGNLGFWGSEDAAWWKGHFGSNGSALPSGSYVYILEISPARKDLIRSGVVFISL